ncbi:MAG: hypothetical protein ACUVSX_11920 [Aggregatilineales bacterium]
MRPDRAHIYAQAPLADVLGVLLRQFKRLLEARGVALSDAEIKQLAASMAKGVPPDERAAAVGAALNAIVAESLGVLASWNLTFAQSLCTKIAAMPGWETTAEFLALANEKVNAELRIAAGATLAAALGDLRHADLLLALIAHDPDEVDAVVARRVLTLLSGVDADAPDWLERVRAWLHS